MTGKLDKNRWGRHFTDDEIAEARDHGRLLTMELETSHICNLRCIYCYNSAGKQLANEMRFERIVDVIDQARDLGARRIIVIGGGEPLMHPRIHDIIEHIVGAGLGVDLFTNGTLVTPDLARWLHDLGVEPVVKCNSLRPEVQDYLVSLPGAHDQIQRGIENLMQAGYPDDDHDLGIESIICAQNCDEIPTLWRWARDRGVSPYMEMITFQGKAKRRQDLNVSVEALHTLFKELARIDREDYGYEWTPHPPIAALNCSRHEYSCTVNSRGYVQPCTGVDVAVGNIHYDSLANILRDSVVIQTLRRVRENVKGACAACEHHAYCYGCRGMAYHLTGDFLAADPLCFYNPDHIRTVENENPEIV